MTAKQHYEFWQSNGEEEKRFSKVVLAGSRNQTSRSAVPLKKTFKSVNKCLFIAVDSDKNGTSCSDCGSCFLVFMRFTLMSCT